MKKKAVSKKPVKAAGKKTTIGASAAKVAYFSKDVPAEFVFYVHNGAVLKNLKDTVKALKKMDDETFSHHVTRRKNDFASWISDIMGYNDLAYNIIGKNKHHMAIEIVNYVSRKTGKKVIL